MRDAPFNIVLMGMGEPLHNYDETMKALRILADEHGFAMSAAPGHAVDRRPAAGARAAGAASRSCRTWRSRCTRRPTRSAASSCRSTGNTASADIIEACKRFPLKKRSRITFEYVLLAGVNDSPDDARRLAKLLAGVKSKVNLIPLNAAAGHSRSSARPTQAIDRFAEILAEHGLIVSVRKSRGRDIRAACGQLIVEGQQVAGQQLATLAVDSAIARPSDYS